jgi:hypothetical protein
VIVDALVKQLDGHMTVVATGGMTVTIRHEHVGDLDPRRGLDGARSNRDIPRDCTHRAAC